MISDITIPAVDLSTCDREPIHVPGSIQPTGVLIVLDGAGSGVLQISRNLAQHFVCDSRDALGKRLSYFLGEEVAGQIAFDLQNVRLSETPVYLRTIPSPLTDGPHHGYHALAHRNPDGYLILELEGADEQESVLFKDLYPLVTTFVTQLQGLRGRDELTALAAREVQRITGFDRVLIYVFDAEWNGTVVAERRNERLPSYLHHHFPASDIPQQARELYRRNRSRLIASSDYEAVELIPELTPGKGVPLDMTYSVLRSVSPIHLEYMRNMGTGSSMSVSILRNGELWGLISCHHHSPKRVAYDARVACDFLAQVLSVQLDAEEYSSEYAERIRLKEIEARLLAEMTLRENFVDGLVAATDDLLAFVHATGAALIFQDELRLVGTTPAEEQVRALAEWVAGQGENEVTHTDCLGGDFPDARKFEDVASGMLGIRISKLHRSYVLWFRPEVVRAIQWAGQPQKTVSSRDGMRLHPRKSFESWRETVRGRSEPWKRTQIEAALDLRNTIVGIVLRKAEELAEVNGELERTNRELEAFSYSVSHDLRAPFRHIVGYAELLRELEFDRLSERGLRYAQTIIDSAQYAGTLVDNLLNFSRIGRTTLNMVTVNLNDLVAEVIRELATETDHRRVYWQIGDLPSVVGDPMMLRLVWRNLLSNAVKYTRSRENAKITIGCDARENETVFLVRDNGVGFDMKYVDKLYGVFQRLHRMEDFEGTGIGLANVRRIVSRHKGRTWAEGAVGEGATFYFTLPVLPEQEVH